MNTTAVSTIEQLVEYVERVMQKVNPDGIASKYQTPFNKDPQRKDTYGRVVNSAVIEIANAIPLADNSGVKQVYTTYYLNENNGDYTLTRHTTPVKSLMTQMLEDDNKVRNEINESLKEAIAGENTIFQYDRLFQTIFSKIINDFQSLGGNTVGLLDKALIRKCKFVRVDRGTLSVGYSPIDKKYIVRYNPKFCVDATVQYFANPVLDESGTYRAAKVSQKNVLYPIMFFLSHEFAHVLYRHVTNSETSLQADLPHYVKQYFGDAYINNSIPYMLGDDYGRTNSGDQSEIHTAKAHHPIGINEQVPVDNYLKQGYVVEIYKTLLSQDASLIDAQILDTLRKYMDLQSTPQTKSSLLDNLGYASIQDFDNAMASLPTDIKKKVFRSHVKFFTGNFYDIMSRIFPQGYSSNSYMRVLRAILESLFEDIKETEAATTKKKPQEPQPPMPSQEPQQGDGEGADGSGEAGDGGDEGADQGGDDADGGDQGGAGDEADDEGEVNDDGEPTGDSTGQGGGEPQGDAGDAEGDGEGDGGQSTVDGDGEGDGESASDSGSMGEDGSTGSETGDQDGSSGESKQHQGKFKVGDTVQQVSTGKVGKIIAIDDDGTYVIDTNQVVQEAVSFFAKLQLLMESIIRVGEDDLITYEATPSNGDSDLESADDQQGSGEPDDGESDGSRDVSSQGDGSESGDGMANGTPSLDQDKMDNSGKDSGDGDGSGSGGDGEDAVPQSDLPSLPPEGSEGQGSPSPQQSQPGDESGGADNQQSGPSEGGGEGGKGGGIQERPDLDDLRRQLDDAHEDAKTGMSDSTSEYLEEDEATREEADNEIDDEEAKDEITKEIQDAVEQAQQDGKNIDEILKGVDKDEINQAFDIDINKRPRQVSQAKWKQVFRQLISMASGYELRRDNAKPSRKVEGLWGANKKVPSIKDVVILLDCSGSMSSTMFKAIFAELKDLGKLPELKDTWIHLIPWGSSATYKRYKGLAPATVKQMYQYGKIDLGGTYIGYGYDMMMKKVRNPDLVIVLTDSEYSDYHTWKRTGKIGTSWGEKIDIDKVMPFIKRMARKTVFVSIEPQSSYMNEMLASDFRRRLLEISSSISKSGGEDFDD